MNVKHFRRPSVLVAALVCCAGNASAQQFSDNFDSGSLAAWGTPFVSYGPITNQVVTAQTGALRMSGLGSRTDPSGPAESLLLPLASSVAQPELYRHGFASVEVMVDSMSSAGLLARVGSLAPSGETSVSFVVTPRPLQGISRVLIEVSVNGVSTTFVDDIVPYDFSYSLLEASWMGDDFIFRATNLNNPLQSASVFVTDSALSMAGGSFLLGVGRSRVEVLEFGATFDNFNIVPAPGTFALFGLAGLAAIRRRR
jgi:hypothetical protein